MEIKLNKDIDLNKIVNEPNFEMFKYNGHICVIIRTSFGNYCGYVGINKKSNCYGLPYYSSTWDNSEAEAPNAIQEKINELRVHGGVTYANDTLPYFRGVFGDNIWWFGFDTSHFQDIKVFDFFESDPGSIYRDFNYVKEQVEKLSDQIKIIEDEK